MADPTNSREPKTYHISNSSSETNIPKGSKYIYLSLIKRSPPHNNPRCFSRKRNSVHFLLYSFHNLTEMVFYLFFHKDKGSSNLLQSSKCCNKYLSCLKTVTSLTRSSMTFSAFPYLSIRSDPCFFKELLNSSNAMIASSRVSVVYPTNKLLD